MLCGRSPHLDAMIDQMLAMGQDQARQDQARQGADQGGADPAEQAVEEVHHRRRGPAQRPAEAVNAEGAAEAVLVHRGIEQREVGGMKDRVAQSRDHRDAGKACEGMRNRDAGEAETDHEETAGQDRPCAVPIDGEASRRLRQAGDAVEDAGEQSDIGIAQPHLLTDDQEHRREGELVEMAGTVSDADQADHPDVMLERRCGCSGHEDLVFVDHRRSASRTLAEMRGGAMRL